MGELVNRGESAIVPEVFYKQVSSILNAARDKAYTAVNFAMVEAYWEIGKSIVDEQGGEERAPEGLPRISEEALASQTFAICVSSFLRFQFATHCVAN